MIKATSEFLAQIDAKAEKLKKIILESETNLPEILGKSIYVSNEGNDDNDGLTPESAIATFEKLETISLNPGDVVFFRRGDMWRIKYYNVAPGVTLSAYGKGKKPIISCSPCNAADPAMWELVEGTKNIWKLNFEICDVGNIEFDNGIFAYKYLNTVINKKYYLYSLKGVTEYVASAIKDIDENEKEFNDMEFDVTKHLEQDLSFIQFNLKDFNNNGAPKLTVDNTGPLYLRCDKGNPGEIFSSIEFLAGRNCLNIRGNSITIDNLCIKHCGAHGVGAGTTLELLVQNCEFGPLGGAIQSYGYNPDTGINTAFRYGNAVEIYGACKDYIVKNCYIHDIYDAGVTHQCKAKYADTERTLKSALVRPGKSEQTFEIKGSIVMEDVKYLDNLFERCIYSIEYFCDQPDGDEDIMRNILMEGNICRFAGGWGWQRPNKVARHIQGGWLGLKRKYPAENYVVKNNIFDRSIDVLVSISSTKESDLPIMQGNTYIQDAGKNYGMYGVPYDKYYPFDEKTEKDVILGKQNENDAKYYVVEG